MVVESNQAAERPRPMSPPEAEAAANVRYRRERLHEGMVDLEEALAAGSAGTRSWRSAIHAAARRMQQTLADHVREAEGRGGLIPQIFEDSPWLAPRADGLIREHVELQACAQELVDRCADADADADDLRERATELVARVARHRHRSADLLYDAYDMDLSAGD